MLTILGNSVAFILREEKIFFYILLINLIVSLIKSIVYVYMDQLIFLTILKIILVMTRDY